MKTFLTHILIICGVFMAISCGEDRTYEYEEKTQHNKWMHDMMLEHYLWADSRAKIPINVAFSITLSLMASTSS